MKRLFFRRSLVALALTLAFFGQVTWALAGTTGGLGGQVTDQAGHPLAGVAVKVTSASQVATTTTDSGGHFVFLALAPDTYTVSLQKEGFNPVSIAGVSIFADQNQSLALRMNSLKTIASVTATASNVVKSGVGSDLYNVNSSSIQATAALGGGTNLNSAYAAIASVPGVLVTSGGMGWNQATFIRGQQAFFSGFEYDGIPVNRAFDNYVASTESNTGLQELEVYTGGGPSSNSSSGTSGFVNQVIKTGTYPGYATLQGGIGGPTYYHQAKIEAGGATPDRNFSYYVGLSGYNQDYRNLDNYNGSDLMQPGDVYSGYSLMDVSTALNGVPRSLAPLCEAGTNVTPAGVSGLPWFDSEATTTGVAAQPTNCFVPYAGNYGNLSVPAMISDRENVANFHFRIPRKNGLSDDIQLLWSGSSMNTTASSSANDAGGYAPYTLAVTGNPYCPPSGVLNGTACAPNYPYYVDAQVYNAPFGTPISGLALQNYYQPSSPTDRSFDSEIPANARDGFFNDTGIVKAQYTHELSDNAYVRAFAYTFFSDWTQAGAESAWNAYANYGVGPADYDFASANYDLITHTAGGELQFTDQLNNDNLLQLTANYTTANVMRFNNDGYTAGSSPIGYISESNGAYDCYDPTSGAAETCAPGGSYESTSVAGPTGTAPAGTPAALAGAYWATLWNGDSSGSYNTVAPHFSFISLSDQWRPSDKLLFNFALRSENYEYSLDSAATPATAFYAQIIQQDICVNSVGSVYSQTLLPGEPPPAAPIYTASCPAGYAHPNFSANSPTSYTIGDLSPRFSATYTESPDTVWRASAGRFTEPPISASVQYLSNSGNELSIWTAGLPLGFESPFHPIPAMSADQFDLSLERHVRGTDWSFKITPFYSVTQGYQEQSFIGTNFVTQAPVGQFRSLGSELSIQKGDFSRNGFSGQLAVTYTDAKVKYQDYYGANQIVSANSAIQQFNELTKGGGGCPYYNAGSCVAAGTTPPSTAILNPYYNDAVQPLLDPSGWYAPGSTGLSPIDNPSTAYYDSPIDTTLILNYRKNKWAITPSLQLTEGNSYGGPLDVIGIDPRTCGQNSATAGITALSPGTNPYQCDALSDVGTYSTAAAQLYVPNFQTGSFSSPGQFRNPWVLTTNLQISYDISPRLSATVTVADIFHDCFGGSKEPWTAAYPAGPNYCAYFANGFYAGNFYNGTSPYDSAANGFTPYAWQLQSYTPALDANLGNPPPLNVYAQLNVRL
ncbi:MAG TPA: TonB-dependent receptor [Candidatus Acidoferrales bacterium]|nr:TonB-dependent receptor [Candidatus Acidoferrales bacterium]